METASATSASPPTLSPTSALSSTFSLLLSISASHPPRYSGSASPSPPFSSPPPSSPSPSYSPTRNVTTSPSSLPFYNGSTSLSPSSVAASSGTPPPSPSLSSSPFPSVTPSPSPSPSPFPSSPSPTYPTPPLLIVLMRLLSLQLASGLADNITRAPLLTTTTTTTTPPPVPTTDPCARASGPNSGVYSCVRINATHVRLNLSVVDIGRFPVADGGSGSPWRTTEPEETLFLLAMMLIIFGRFCLHTFVEEIRVCWRRCRLGLRCRPGCRSTVFPVECAKIRWT